jgi:hypothetical protein
VVEGFVHTSPLPGMTSALWCGHRTPDGGFIWWGWGAPHSMLGQVAPAVSACHVSVWATLYTVSVVMMVA